MSSPLTLAIETSNPSASTDELGPGVALGWAGAPADGAEGSSGRPEIIDEERLSRSSRHDDELMPAIARLFDRCGYTPQQLERVVVSVGPGGLTGLRIAVVAAAAMAEALGIDCVPVPSSRVAFEHARDQGPVGIMLASKKDRGWLAVYDEGSERVVGDCDASALGEASIRTLCADPAMPESWREAARALDIRTMPLRLSAAACLRASRTLGAVDPSALRVLYPREPDAVTAWRALHGLPDAPAAPAHHQHTSGDRSA